MNARLYCKTGALAGSAYQIEEEATIGRGEGNDITLPPDALSEQHARIFFDDEADCYVLEDLGSDNGTKLDDAEVIEPVPLEDLHVITFAETADFIFQTVDDEAVSSTAEEGTETQFGRAPESPSTLPGGEEPEGDQTQMGTAPGTLPDFSDEDSASEHEEETTEDEDHTRFGEAPPELPDFSEEDDAEEERTQMGGAPGNLPDLPDEETSPEDDEDTTEDEDHTRFGESPPELPDFSEEDESDGDHTQMGEAPGTLPDLPEEDTPSEEETTEDEDHTRFGESPPELPDFSEEDDAEEERTQMGGAPGNLPDLPDEETSPEDDEDTTEDDQTRFGETPPEPPDLSEEPSAVEDEEEEDQTQMGPGAPGLPDFSEDEPSSEDDVEDRAAEVPQYAVQVVTEDGPQDTYSLPHRGEVTIGRSPDCDIQVEDPGVSREHARLIVESDEIVVEDMGSKNFTFVDGERLSEPTALSPGSEIQFGLQVKAVLQRTSS